MKNRIISSSSEVIVPVGKNRKIVVPCTEFNVDGEILTGIDQTTAVMEAHKQGGFVLSNTDYWKAIKYAEECKEDYPAFYNLMFNPIFPRWTSTQVHRANTDCPIVVNLQADNKYGLVTFSIDNVIEAPWLPKTGGYIQELDKRTGLPRKVGELPSSEFFDTYYDINPNLGTLAVVRNWCSGLYLSLRTKPSETNNRLAVAFAKKYSGEILEKRLR